MRLIGYGEDGLTAWSLTHRLDLVQEGLRKKFSESCDRSNWTVFFRPSVGRGIGGSFGEFDAIIATQSHVYLVESKWEDKVTKRPRRGSLKIGDVQIRRHEIFEWIKQQWDADQPLDGWAGFAARNKVAFKERFPGRQLVKPGRRLSDNLTFLLNQTIGRTPKHVLLYFYRSKTAPYNSVVPDDGSEPPVRFVIVPIQYCLIQEPSLFFEMTHSVTL